MDLKWSEKACQSVLLRVSLCESDTRHNAGADKQNLAFTFNPLSLLFSSVFLQPSAVTHLLEVPAVICPLCVSIQQLFSPCLLSDTNLGTSNSQSLAVNLIRDSQKGWIALLNQP